MTRQSHLCSPPAPLTLPAIPFPLDAWCFFFLEEKKKKKKKKRKGERHFLSHKPSELQFMNYSVN